MSDPKSDKCSVTVWKGFANYPCRRPVNRDGMCGLHASAKEKRERHTLEQKEKFEEAKKLRDEAKRQAAELTALGVNCYWTSNGEVVLSDPEKLIQELGSVDPDGRSR